MLHLAFTIHNPFRFKSATPYDYVAKEWNIATNKSLELQISKWSSANNLISIVLDLEWYGDDHAGPGITFELWKYYFCLKLYDHRHWDNESDDWEVYKQHGDDK